MSLEPDNSPENFTEDYHHENGQYQNLCYVCGCYFIGYKRRMICRTCAFCQPIRVTTTDNV